MPPFPAPPQPLVGLYTDLTPTARRFREHARSYNSVLQLASSAAKVDEQFAGGVHQFRINGTLHHRMGPLLPPHGDSGERPAFAQLYILDPEAQLQGRMSTMRGLDQGLVQQLQQMLLEHNQYVRTFRSVGLEAQAGDVPDVQVVINQEGVPDRRRYNAPAAAEVAGFMPEGAGAPRENRREIVVHMRGGGCSISAI